MKQRLVAARRVAGRFLLAAIGALRSVAAAVARWLAAYAWDLFWMAGLAALGRGIWFIYPPAAWIVVGTIMLVLGVWISSQPAKPPGGG